MPITFDLLRFCSRNHNFGTFIFNPEMYSFTISGPLHQSQFSNFLASTLSLSIKIAATKSQNSTKRLNIVKKQ